jgi:integral membrane protein (TIGR01906 family)
MSDTLIPTSTTKSPIPLSGILRSYMTLALPFLLALIAIRLVMTPFFLQFEYNQASFPEDTFGFTREDRLTYAPYAIQYLLNSEDIDFLGNLKFPDGSSMYNARELHHMRDVKTITQYTYLLAVMGGAAYLIVFFYLYWNNRPLLRAALWNGAVFTLALIGAIIVIAILNWDFFFTGFHTLFFSGGTWRFEYSDTLIRLFPEQFWFDAALLIGSLTALTAILILAISWRWNMNAFRHD